MLLVLIASKARRFWLGSASAGVLAWGLVELVAGFPLGISLWLGAPLVLAPLTLSLLSDRMLLHPRLWLAIAGLQLPAALLLLTLSPMSSLPWLVVTLLIALAGAIHFWKHRFTSIAELGIDFGMMYLAVGGGWTVLARFGARPLDFSDAIVQATATHFHYAGLPLPVLAGLAARRLGDRFSQATVLAVIAGVPLVAAGITSSAFGSRWVEWLAAWFMAGAGTLLAIQQFRLAAGSSAMLPRGLFVISGVSLLAGMALAGTYALGNCLGIDWLDIPTMIRTHGVVNALGFALAGVLAWQVWTDSPAAGA